MKKKLFKVLILIIAIGVVTLLCINSREIVNFTSTFNNARMTGNTDELLSYIVYDNQDSAKIKILVNINANDIIEYVVRPDGEIINGNGKNSLYIDYETALNEESEWKIKLKKNNEITKKFVVNRESYNNYVELEDEKLNIDLSIFSTKIKNVIMMNNDTVYYKTSNNSSKWTEYNDKITIKDSDIIYNDEGGKVYINLKKVDQSGNIVYIDKEIQIVKPNKFDPSIAFSTEFGTIDIIWLDTDNNVIAEPNSPENSIVSNGEALRPVAFNSSANAWEEVSLPATNSWYDYSQNKWANVMTATTNNSFFVWIPRYAYRITYYDGYTIDEDNNYIPSGQPTGYYDGLGMWRAGDGEVKYVLDKGIETVNYDGNKYIVHPAFETNLDNGGWSTDLPGFWFAKYDMSGSGTTLASIYGVNATASDKVGVLYKSGRQATYGYNGTIDDDGNTSFMNSHMSKNSEWGAVVYLTMSQYGKITTNTEQSTTGNEYGIFDMEKYYSKRVSAFNCTDTKGEFSKNNWTLETGLTTNSSSTKYATKYNNTSNVSVGNAVVYNYGKVGDATKEVYKGGAYDETVVSDYGVWFKKRSDPAEMIYSEYPFFGRFGAYGIGFDARRYYKAAVAGSAFTSVKFYFRTVLCPN